MKPTTATSRIRSDLPPSYARIYSPFSPKSYSCCQCGGKEHPILIAKGHSIPSCRHQHDPRTCFLRHDGEAHRCQIWNQLGQPALMLKIPAIFRCSCEAEHSAFEIMAQNIITCRCGAPDLQAIYDQFRTILLWPQGDSSIDDLTDPEKVAEIRRHLFDVGGAVWLEEREKVLEYFKAEGSVEFLHGVEEIKGEMERLEDIHTDLAVETEVSPSPSLSPSFSPSPSPSLSEDFKVTEVTEMLLSGTETEPFSAKKTRGIVSVRHTRGWSQASGASVETEDSSDAEMASLAMMTYPDKRPAVIR